MWVGDHHGASCKRSRTSDWVSAMWSSCPMNFAVLRCVATAWSCKTAGNQTTERPPPPNRIDRAQCAQQPSVSISRCRFCLGGFLEAVTTQTGGGDGRARKRERASDGERERERRARAREESRTRKRERIDRERERGETEREREGRESDRGIAQAKDRIGRERESTRESARHVRERERASDTQRESARVRASVKVIGRERGSEKASKLSGNRCTGNKGFAGFFYTFAGRAGGRAGVNWGCRARCLRPHQPLELLLLLAQLLLIARRVSRVAQK